MRNSQTIKFGVAILSISLLAACGSNTNASDTKINGVATTDESVDNGSGGNEVASTAILIDVRTVEEFAEGHLQGALNYNVEDGSLEAALSSLDPSASYQVYCRSGRRSALAVQIMTANGFTQIEDLGSVAQANAATGIPVVVT